MTNEILENRYVIEVQYFPAIDWFKLATKFCYFKIEQYETFQKMTYRNRCVIAGSNGLVNCTVPLQNGRQQKTFIRDVIIDYTQPWQKQHWRTLQSSYSRAPFFEFFANDVHTLLSGRHKFLFDLNLEIIHWLKKVLQLTIEVELTTSFINHYADGREIDLRNTILPKNLKTKYDNWQPAYTQVFEDKFGFVPNLSVLDLLFCKGKL